MSKKSYIEREAATALFSEKIYAACGNAMANGLTYGRRLLDSIPPADVKPIVKGEWKCVSKEYPNYGLWNKWCCSCCGYIRTTGWEHTSEGKRPNACFCENCGADMRKEVEE